MAGTSSGPTPWWQLPGQASKLTNLEQSAPAGYSYNPVNMQYERTPTSAGSNINAFETAALGGAPGGRTPASLLGLEAGGSAGGGLSATGVPGVSGAPGGVPGTSGAAYVPQVQMPDTSAATASAFATAKDQAGQIARSSLDSLAGELGAQGQLGSGEQFQKTGEIVGQAANTLGQESRSEAETNANLAADFAKTGYQGAISQRGQDIQAQEAAAQLAEETRLAQQNQTMQMLALALRGIGSGSPSSSQYTSAALY